MADISGKIAKIKALIDMECYFTINRARQYGKTTTIAALERELKEEYIVVSISFEGLGDESFASSEAFCNVLIKHIVKSLRFTSATDEYIDKWAGGDVSNFDLLSDHITAMCKSKKVVLMIDEVDKTSNNRVFLHFLSMLRNKFLARENDRDYTFHSVILAGVYDIKNIKLKMTEEGLYKPSETENKVYNSPWNIAVDFEVDMSFNPSEIAAMLGNYESDHNIKMDIAAISEEIYSYTSGYPFLVSRICKHIDEKLNMDWTAEGVQKAVDIILHESNTLFDDVFKNLENNKELHDLIYGLLVVGETRDLVIDNPVINTGFMYGFLKKKENGMRTITIANKIFEIRMLNYFISKNFGTKNQIARSVLQRDIVRDGVFDMELCLCKFAEHYAEIFSDADVEFLERHGRLLFLSYLKPLINGQGFYHIESQFTDLRRMDVVVDFGRQQFIIELKLWRGEQYRAEAYAQLCGYLETKRVDTGYLLSFDFRKESNKVRKTEWIETGGKRIFDVMV